MANFTDTFKNQFLNTLPGTMYITTHTADPGSTGVNMVSGTDRQAAVFASAVAGARTSSAVLDYTIPASTTVTYVGFWDAAAAGNFIGSSLLASPPTFASEDTLRLTNLEANLNLICA